MSGGRENDKLLKGGQRLLKLSQAWARQGRIPHIRARALLENFSPEELMQCMYRKQADVPISMSEDGLHQKVNVDADIISYAGLDDGKVGMYIAPNTLNQQHNYFEVDLLELGPFSIIDIGLVPSGYPLDRDVGAAALSVAYRTCNGKVYKANTHGRPFGPRCDMGDRIGCGIRFSEERNEGALLKRMITVFFTRNGKEMGSVLVPYLPGGLHPAVGLHTEGEIIRMVLDAEWLHEDIIHMSIDSCEEDWLRLHDIQLNGQILEYTGRGKTISDVGIAQARLPLDTTHHYFEMEIIDPGENCYIAIGLARRDYPKHRHPGWNKGSIAYHADDGKIFVGRGVGDVFGPTCQKGDIMGCGIFFPRDYRSSSSQSDDVSDDQSEDYIEDYHLSSEESEDEEWGIHPGPDQGPKIKVFFTRNGKTIGHKEIYIPKGGFYPTVGMLSSDEKVRVDLRPLTG